jgi:hypothetical protein
MLSEQENEEYRKKLANAPRKAIYAPVPIQCPQCSGMRVVNEATHKIKCPFCDFEEPLTILRYEVDPEAFEAQLQKEKEMQAERLTQYQNDKNRSIAWGLLIAFIIVFLLVLVQFCKYS